MITSVLRSAALMALCAPALWAAPGAQAAESDFALRFPIEAPSGETVFAIELPPEAYASLIRADARDLSVIDADGREQAFAWRPGAEPAEVRTLSFDLPLPIALPAPMTADDVERLDLRVRRDGEGRLSAIDLSSGPSAKTAATEWLLDLGETRTAGIDGLRFSPANEVGDFRVLINVRGSDDLVRWTSVASAMPLLRASESSRSIERLDARFGRTTFRYLSLSMAGDTGELPALQALSALRDQGPPAPERKTVRLEATSIIEPGLVYEYASPGPLPIVSLDVLHESATGVREFELARRMNDQWQPILAGSTWTLAVGGSTLRSAPQPVSLGGTGPLRLSFREPTAAPSLVLAYRADRLVIVATGRAPYQLLVGSAAREARPASIDAALQALKKARGDDWAPALAALGPPSVAGGPAALAPPRDPAKWGLWLILLLGAAVVGGAAWRFLGKPTPEGPAQPGH